MARFKGALRSLGIRTRLLALVLCGALPFGGYVVFDALAGARLVEAQVVQQQVAVARLIAARFDDNVGNIDQLLATLAHVVVPSDESIVANDRLLEGMLPDVPSYVRNVVVFDVAGHSVGASEPAMRQGIDVHDRHWFQSALLLRQLVVEGPLTARGTGEHIAVFARPILHDGVITGVVTASVGIGHLDRLVDAGGVLPKGAVALLVDRDGGVLNAGGTQAGGLRSVARVEEPAGAYEREDDDGIVRSYGYAKARTTSWAIHVGADRNAAAAPVWRHMRETLSIGGAIVLAAVLLALLIARQIVRPLSRLTEDARRLSHGELGHRTRIVGHGEVGALGEALNRMAAEIERETAALARSERKLRLVADNLPALIAIVDRDLRFRFCNESYRAWFGTDPALLVGQPFQSLLGEKGFAEERPYCERALRGERVRFERTGQFGNEERHVLVAFVPMRDARGTDAMRDAESIDGFYVMVQDLTERRRLEARMERMAQFDELTGLPNRYLLHDRLAQACHRSDRDASQVALLYLDLDGFKPINDRYGHAAGDCLLRAIGERLARAVRRSDTVARVGGDEFVVLIEGFASYHQLRGLARSLIEVVKQPVIWETGEIACSVSIGGAAYPPCRSWESLLATADAAMYEAKTGRRDKFVMAPVRDAAADAIARAALADADAVEPRHSPAANAIERQR